MTGSLQAYGDPDRSSGVTHFVLLPAAMILLFANGAAYLYTEQYVGSIHLHTMQRFAAAGRGLSTYINRNIGERYTDKLSPEQVATLRADAAKPARDRSINPGPAA